MQYAAIFIIWCILAHRAYGYGYVIDDINRFGRKPKKNNKWLHYSGAYEVDGRMERRVGYLLHLLVYTLVWYLFGIRTATLWLIMPTNVQVWIWRNGKRYAISAILALSSLLCPPYTSLLLCYIPFWQYIGLPVAAMHIYIVPIAAIVFLFKRKHIIGIFNERYTDKIKARDTGKISARKLIVSVKLYAWYFWHCAFPIKVAFYHPFIQGFGISNIETDNAYKIDGLFYAGIATILAAVLLGGTGVIWYTLFILPWLHMLIHVTMNTSDRYTYLASIGVAMIAASCPDYVYFTLCGFYAYKTYCAMVQYKDLETFYNYNIAECPRSQKAYLQWGQVLMATNRPHDAYRYIAAGLRYHPADFALNISAASCANQYGDKSLAKDHLEAAKTSIFSWGKESCEETIKIVQNAIDSK